MACPTTWGVNRGNVTADRLKTDFVVASDQRVARATGPWAKDKLRNIARYADMVTTGVAGKFGGGVNFVDLMAGTGLCVDTSAAAPEEFAGSTLIAMDTRVAFTRIVAVESNSDAATALKARVGAHSRASSVSVIHGDCNDADVIAQIRALTANGLTVAFADLLGTEIKMDTLRRLTTGRSVDPVFTWPEMDAKRNQGLLLDQQARWTEFFGSDAWIPLVTRFGPARRLNALQRFYVERLRQIGYKHFKYSDSVKNTKRAALYRPMLATKHPLGLKFWNVASAKQGQQGTLFV